MAKTKIIKPKPSGFFLDGPALNLIGKFFGGSIIKTKEDLIDKLTRSQQVRLGDGLEVALTTDDLHALRQQSIGMSRPFDEYVREFVIDSVGLQLNGFMPRR